MPRVQSEKVSPRPSQGNASNRAFQLRSASAGKWKCQLLAEMDEIVRRCLKAPRCMPDPGRRNFAERQMRRQHRGGVECGAVAVCPVSVDSAFDKAFEAFPGRRFARCPDLLERGCPVGIRRQQVPVVELLRCNGLGQGGKACRRVDRFMGFARPLQRFPEGRVDTKGFLLTCQQAHRVVQQLAGETVGSKAARLQPGLDLAIDRDTRRVVPAVPVHRIGARFGNQRVDNGRGRPAAQDERRSKACQFAGERGKGMVQPPALGAAERAGSVLRRLADIEWDDRSPGLCRCGKGGVIVDAQVLAEPDDDRCRVFRHQIIPSFSATGGSG
jgi:hypothetical protein